MHTEVFHYQADGVGMEGWLAYDGDRSARRPGALVFPAMPGIGRQSRASAERLAECGYVALACDLYGGGKLYDEVEDARGPLEAIRDNLDSLRARATGAMHALAALPNVDHERMVALGYCFGGVMALELARSGAPVLAVAGFHAPLKAARPQDAANIKGKILACIGSEDVDVGPDHRAAFEQEMRAGGVDWRLHVYGGVYHSFTNPDADSYNKPHYARYDPVAHARSWREMLDLFDEAFAAAA